MTERPRRVLTIAGSDSGGGAGIQADLKTFTVMDCYGMSAVTALTAQNTCGVLGISPVPADFVRAQIDAVAGDIGVDAVKTGMLATPEIVRETALAVKRWAWTNVVLDPVIVAKSGDHLLAPEARGTVIEELLPLVLIVTPNRYEAEVLAGRPVRDLDSAARAAEDIAALGPRYVVLKGGHLGGDKSIDLVHDGGGFHLLEAPRVGTRNTHGTGCTFSAAIAAALAHGLDPLDAIAAAKEFITSALVAAGDWRVGNGHGPVDHCRAVELSWRPRGAGPVPWHPDRVSATEEET